jgi:hypothetical protein
MIDRDTGTAEDGTGVTEHDICMTDRYTGVP